MSTTVDRITTYAEWASASDRCDALRAEMRAVLDRPDREAYDRLVDEHHAIVEAMYDDPGLDLFRICWLVDNWERSHVDPDIDEDGDVDLCQVAWRDDVDDHITTAHEVRWLIERLLTELRALRPELRPITKISEETSPE